MDRLLSVALLLSACGSAQSAPPAPRAAEPEPREEEARAVPAPEPGPAERALAAIADGTPVLVLDTGERRFVIVAEAEATADTTPADAPVIETDYHRIRLEDATDVVEPRALHLAREGGACRFLTTRTFRAEVAAIEADASEPAARAAWVAEGTTDACPSLDERGAIAIVGDAAPAIEPLAFEQTTGAAARRELARIPRTVTPRPIARGALARASWGASTVLASASEADEDGCVSAETTYVIGADAQVTAIAGSPSPFVVRGAAGASIVVIDATTDAGRPATMVRIAPLEGPGPAVELAVPIPWMTAPSC